MKNKYILLIIFMVVVAAQIYVPTSMILDREEILETGKLYKFKTSTVDPEDPMRGKYITLSFEDDLFEIPSDSQFVSGMEIFTILNIDNEGFAIIDDIKIDKPTSDLDFVKAEVSSASFYSDTARINIRYPFTRYYMEEYSAPLAEDIYFKSTMDSTSITYALVKIKDGEAVLEDVMIDGVSINEIVADQKPE